MSHRVTACPRRVPEGFTLVELVIVIVLAGILAVVAFARFVDRSAFEARGYREGVRAALRYAHKHAIASGCNVRATVDAAGYRLRRSDSCTGTADFSTDVRRPDGGGAFSGGTPSGVTVSGSIDVWFDSGGRPYDAASGNALSAPASATVGGETVTVEHVTGYVH